MPANKERLSKEEALSFLLAYIVVEQNEVITLDQMSLFRLTNLAQRAVTIIDAEEGHIPHEIIEQLAREFMAT